MSTSYDRLVRAGLRPTEADAILSADPTIARDMAHECRLPYHRHKEDKP